MREIHIYTLFVYELIKESNYEVNNNHSSVTELDCLYRIKTKEAKMKTFLSYNRYVQMKDKSNRMRISLIFDPAWILRAYIMDCWSRTNIASRNRYLI